MNAASAMTLAAIPQAIVLAENGWLSFTRFAPANRR